jgi:transcriptional regulator NrdR family protein
MRNMRHRFICDDCGFTTTSDYVLEAHTKFAHKVKVKTRAKVTKRKTCEDCGKRFNKDSTFKKHMTTIHGAADVE